MQHINLSIPIFGDTKKPIVITCKKGECRYLEGNLRAQKRAEAVDALLQEIGMGKGRMAVIQLKEGGTEQLIGEIEDFLDEIKEKKSIRLPGNFVRNN